MRREQPVGVDGGAAQRDDPLAVAVLVDPADGRRVAAAIEGLERGDEGEGVRGRRSRDGGRGVQRGDEVERTGLLAELDGDVGGEVPEVGQLEGEGQFARGDGAGVRAQRLQHALHGEGVLVEVFRARGERRGGRGVVGRVGSPRGAAGKNARARLARVHVDERLRARADEAVDREGEAVRVGLGELVDERATVTVGRNAGGRIPGDDDLLELSAADAGEGLGDDAHEGVAAEARGGECGARALADRARQRCGDGLEATLLDAQARDPGDPLVAADDELGHDECACGTGVVGEGEGAERDEPAAGAAHRVVDVSEIAHRTPLSGGLGDPVGAPVFESQRLSHAHDAVAAAQGDKGSARFCVGQERPGVGHGLGDDSQHVGGRMRRGRSGGGHGSSVLCASCAAVAHSTPAQAPHGQPRVSAH